MDCKVNLDYCLKIIIKIYFIHFYQPRRYLWSFSLIGFDTYRHFRISVNLNPTRIQANIYDGSKVVFLSLRICLLYCQETFKKIEMYVTVFQKEGYSRVVSIISLIELNFYVIFLHFIAPAPLDTLGNPKYNTLEFFYIIQISIRIEKHLEEGDKINLKK